MYRFVGIAYSVLLNAASRSSWRLANVGFSLLRARDDRRQRFCLHEGSVLAGDRNHSEDKGGGAHGARGHHPLTGLAGFHRRGSLIAEIGRAERRDGDEIHLRGSVSECLSNTGHVHTAPVVSRP